MIETKFLDPVSGKYFEKLYREKHKRTFSRIEADIERRIKEMPGFEDLEIEKVFAYPTLSVHFKEKK